MRIQSLKPICVVFFFLRKYLTPVPLLSGTFGTDLTFHSPLSQPPSGQCSSSPLGHPGPGFGLLLACLPHLSDGHVPPQEGTW